MLDQVQKRLQARFQAYADLAELLDEDLLNLRVEVPKHKSLAEHLWCVVGARESYARSLEDGDWAGFSCSMQSFSADDFRTKLRESSTAVETALQGIQDWDPVRSDLLATLAEHEVMHEGQIIRHMYALERELPASWVWA